MRGGIAQLCSGGGGAPMRILMTCLCLSNSRSSGHLVTPQYTAVPFITYSFTAAGFTTTAAAALTTNAATLAGAYCSCNSCSWSMIKDAAGRRCLMPEEMPCTSTAANLRTMILPDFYSMFFPPDKSSLRMYPIYSGIFRPKYRSYYHTV